MSPESKALVHFNDFQKLDIRVGTILEVFDFPGARKPAFQLRIDFGDIGIKRSSAQITSLYTKEELTGMQVLAVVNFPEKQIGHFFSECLVLGIENENKEVLLLRPDKKVSNGLPVS